jgi:hypothetical protein
MQREPSPRLDDRQLIDPLQEAVEFDLFRRGDAALGISRQELIKAGLRRGGEHAFGESV